MMMLVTFLVGLAMAAQPLPERHTRLLTSHKYVLQGQNVIDPSGLTIPPNEVPFVLHRLESSQRLRALLQINIILNKSEGERRLTPAEREAIRAVAKENWAYFTLATRKDFKRYFSVEELMSLEAAPPPIAEAAVFELRDQEPVIAEAEEPKTPRKGWFRARLPSFMRRSDAIPDLELPAVAAIPAPVALPAPTAVPTPVPATESLPAPTQPTAPPASVPIPTPAAAPVPTPAPAAVAAVTAPPVPVAAPPPAAPAGPVLAPSYGLAPTAAPAAPPLVPAPVAVLPPARVDVLRPSTAGPAGFVFGQGETPLPVAPITPTIPAQALAEEQRRVEAANPVNMPKLEPVTQEALELFLHSAPYGREAKALLRLIHARAPQAARDRALNTVFFSLPAITIDDAKAADGWGSAVPSMEPPILALRPGLNLLRKRRMLISSEELLLPESFEFAGLKAPSLEAFKGKGGDRQEKDPEWGEVRIYEDGSKRVPVSPEQQAGALLYELLRLDARLRREDVSRAAVEVWARGFQSMFYSAVQNALGHDRFLDPVQRLSLRRWLDQPEEERDHLYLSWTAARSGAIDSKRGSPAAQRRHDEAVAASCETASPIEIARRLDGEKLRLEKTLDALNETGLFEASAVKKARDRFKASVQPVLCSVGPVSKLIGELNGVETVFRQDRLGAPAQ